MMAEIVALPLRQINLYNASLLPTREVFSARLIVGWVVVAAIAMAAVAWWAVIETRKINLEIANQASRQVAERARTLPVLPTGEVLQTPQQLVAREQALRSQQTLLEARRAAREVLKRGIASEKSGPSALLRQLANSVPPPLWLSEVRVVGSRIDISGKTLEPAAVHLWLERLRAAETLAIKPVPAVRLERVDTAVQPPALPATQPVAQLPARTPPVYTFAISAALAIPFADEGGRP